MVTRKDARTDTPTKQDTARVMRVDARTGIRKDTKQVMPKDIRQDT